MRALLALLFAAHTALAQEPPPWFTESLLDLREDVAEAAAQGKRVMVYFGQGGCPYCKRLMEVNFRDAAIAAKTRQHFVALALNIWGDREVTWSDGVTSSEKQLAARLKVQFTPTLVFLDERGRVALRLNGYYPPREFEAALDHAAGKVRAVQKPVPGGAALTPQPFFMAPPYDLRRRPGGKPLALLFEAPACERCDELHAGAFQQRAVREQLARFDVVRLSLSETDALIGLDGRNTTPAALARALAVGFVPTLVLFDARGREVFRAEAYLRAFHLAGALDYVSSGAYAREPSFQRFLQSKAERMRSRGERVDLWN
jgi:thioredoxin-related protein